EVADLAEAEELLVELAPLVHASLVDVVGEVVDLLQARAARPFFGAGDGDEVDVVDRELTLTPTLSQGRGRRAIAVHQINQASANPLQRGDVQLHRADFR